MSKKEFQNRLTGNVRARVDTGVSALQQGSAQPEERPSTRQSAIAGTVELLGETGFLGVMPLAFLWYQEHA